MKYIGEVFQDRRRDYLDIRNGYYHQNMQSCDLVMIGDSITEGFNLNFAGVTRKVVLNSGVSGDRLKNISKRIDVDAIELKPKQIMLMAGINDLLSDDPFTINNYKQEITKLYKCYISNIDHILTTNIEPVCCGIIKISKYEHNFNFKNKQIELFNDLLKSYAEERKLIFVNYNDVLEDKYGDINNTFFSDGLHPNEKGYFAMYKYLKKLEVL